MTTDSKSPAPGADALGLDALAARFWRADAADKTRWPADRFRKDASLALDLVADAKDLAGVAIHPQGEHYRQAAAARVILAALRLAEPDPDRGGGDFPVRLDGHLGTLLRRLERRAGELAAADAYKAADLLAGSRCDCAYCTANRMADLVARGVPADPKAAAVVTVTFGDWPDDPLGEPVRVDYDPGPAPTAPARPNWPDAIHALHSVPSEMTPAPAAWYQPGQLRRDLDALEQLGLIRRAERFVAGRLLQHHQRTDDGERFLAGYLAGTGWHTGGASTGGAPDGEAGPC
jgi:hypothetical protein